MSPLRIGVVACVVLWLALCGVRGAPEAGAFNAPAAAAETVTLTLDAPLHPNAPKSVQHEMKKLAETYTNPLHSVFVASASAAGAAAQAVGMESPATMTADTSAICVGEHLQLHCPDQVIRITSARWGRKQGSTACLPQGLTGASKMGCQSDVTAVIAGLCNGLPSCTAQIQRNAFPNTGCGRIATGYISAIDYDCVDAVSPPALTPPATIAAGSRRKLLQTTSEVDTVQTIACDPSYTTGQVMSLTHTRGQITDKIDSYSAYGDNWECNFLIQPDLGGGLGVVSLVFDRIDLEGGDTYNCRNCSCDGITVYDGKNAHAPVIGESICGVHTDTVSYLSSGSAMYVSFTSDSFLGGSGFRAYFNAVPLEPASAVTFSQHDYPITYSETGWTNTVVGLVLVANISQVPEADTVGLTVSSQDARAVAGTDYTAVDVDLSFTGGANTSYAYVTTDIAASAPADRRLPLTFTLALTDPQGEAVLLDPNQNFSWPHSVPEPVAEKQYHALLPGSLATVTLEPYTATVQWARSNVNVSEDASKITAVLECYQCEDVEVTVYIIGEPGHEVEGVQTARGGTDFELFPVGYNVTFPVNLTADATSGAKQVSVDIPLLKQYHGFVRGFIVRVSEEPCPRYWNAEIGDDWCYVTEDDELNANITVEADDSLIVYIEPSESCGFGIAVNASRSLYYCQDAQVSAEVYLGITNTSSNATSSNSNCTDVVKSLHKYLPLDTPDLNLTSACRLILGDGNDTTDDFDEQYFVNVTGIDDLRFNRYINQNWSLGLNTTVFEDLTQLCEGYVSNECFTGCTTLIDFDTLCACPFDYVGTRCNVPVPVHCNYSFTEGLDNPRSAQLDEHRDQLHGEKPLYAVSSSDAAPSSVGVNVQCAFTQAVSEGIPADEALEYAAAGWDWGDEAWIQEGFNYSVLLPNNEFALSSFGPVFVRARINNFRRLSANTEHVATILPEDLVATNDRHGWFIIDFNALGKSYSEGGRFHVETRVTAGIAGLNEMTQYNFIENLNWSPSPKQVEPLETGWVIFILVSIVLLIIAAFAFVYNRRKEAEERAVFENPNLAADFNEMDEE